MARTGVIEAGTSTYINTTGKQVITSGPAVIVGIAFVGTGTGQIQLFAGATCSASLSPMVTFSATSSAVAGGFSPMFLRWPAEVSGNGLTVDLGATSDPNLVLFWSPGARS